MALTDSESRQHGMKISMQTQPPTKKEFTMNIQSLMKSVTVLLSLCLLVSCVGTGKKSAQNQEAAQAPVVEKLDKQYDTLLFSPFTIEPEFSKDYPDAAKTIQQSMMTALQQEKCFKKVDTIVEGTSTGDKTLLIKTNITNMRIVSNSARIWGGAFAGSSGVEMDLQLIDGTTKKVVRNEKMSSWNNAFGAAWSFGSSDHSLLDDMGKVCCRIHAEKITTTRFRSSGTI